MTWSSAFRSSKFKIEFSVTLILLALILTALANFLNFIESRTGTLLNDPILNLFQPIDLTWLTFAIIYVSLLAALIIFAKDPDLLLTAFQSYILLTVFRIAAMYLVPLNPPEKMISLSDPFVEFFGTGQLLTKDLFFSGHTATIFLLFLLTRQKFLRIFFFISTITVALSVLLQHVHYSIDVFAAPFFAYCSFNLVKNLRFKFSQK
ncbi:MAG TPA: phosphatase PAP2-related protein [Ignavibacteriaceae bacterium]|nr:phosphatase PAP2-related protein [Ignavibacteriaceae bacterium]